jgi:ATP-dependent helicase HrpA
LRVELVTALIKSLPKQVRKNFIPAPDVARTAVETLHADFDPARDQLEPSLELALRRLKGHIIPPGSWNRDTLPAHLLMSFQVVDANGRILDEDKDLLALQDRLAPQTRRAIADSLGATPSSIQPTQQAGRRKKAGAPPSSSLGADPGIREVTGATSWTFGTVPREVSRIVGGHRVTGYPALVDEQTAVGLSVFPNPAEQSAAMRAGVIRLLALRVPSPARYVLEHLSNTEKLTFTQNPHGSVSALIEDCSIAAIDKLTPGELPWSGAEFDALYETVRAELIDTVFTVTATVEKILASARRIEKRLKGSTSLALITALNDVRSQLEQLVFPGFVATTGYAQLAHLPRFLAGIEKRLEKLETNVQRDALNTAIIQRLEDEYDDAVAAVAPNGRTVPPGLRRVRWMLEELRISLFAQELGTAYSVSEKRVRAALGEALAA